MTDTASLARFGVWEGLIPRLEAGGWAVGGGAHPEAVPLLEELRRGPDPEGALERLGALAVKHPDLTAAARADPALGRALVALCGSSPALVRTVQAHPDWLGDAVAGRLPPAPDAADPMVGIRRFTRMRMLDIAVRDLTGVIDMPTAGRELADLADAAAGAALDAARAEEGGAPPFAIIAMGKWGARELNYASDIDLLFVYDGDAADADADRAARRLAERFTTLLDAMTPDGRAFRVDPDLRPEGRAGALARSLASYAAYYERWAQTWEFQALIKARPAAGDERIGSDFMAMIEPFVYPETLDPEAVRAVRAMKRRGEEQERSGGGGRVEIKRGVGGIRDAEFAVQLLQLVHGRFDRSLRATATLDVLAALGAGGYVRPEDATDLAESYRWLRNVEHRIQLVELRQTHVLPDEAVAREQIAKSLGHRDTATATALEHFDGELIRHRAAVRTIHERLFYRPLLEAFAASATVQLSPQQAARQAAALGFVDVDGAQRAFADLTAGLSRRSRLMQQLLPLMLDWLSESPNPDLGLRQLSALVRGTTDNATLVAALRDNPVAAERLCRLLGTSRLLGRFIDRIPEALALLGDDARLGAAADRDAIHQEAERSVARRADPEAALASLRRFVRRTRLHVAVRDLLEQSDAAAVGRELSDLADAAAEAGLAVAAARVAARADHGPVPFAVIAMGKWGGRELNYSSDLDLLFVYEPPDGADAGAVQGYALKLAEEFVRALAGVTPEGKAYRIDADLRPEGKDGALARSLESYRAYYERWALTWEHQALLKARAAAGDRRLGEAFCEVARRFSYPDRPTAETLREIRHMKARIERERIPPDEDPAFHMKLGPGGMSDVEFTAQLLQFRNGAGRPDLHRTGTLDALAALASAGVLDADEAGQLAATYGFCARVRNRLYLQTGKPRDSLPTDPAEAVRLAVSLGMEINPAAQLREAYRRHTRRARRIVEHRFFEGA